MAVYKNISAKNIVAKIYRDLLLEDPNYEYDIIEWIGEALAFIGAGSQLVLKNVEIPVFDFRAEMPTDLLVLKQLKYYAENDGRWKIIKYNPSNFDPHEDDSPNKFVTTEETYSTTENYIKTTFEEGKILLAYKGYPIDDDGYPAVPENQYFKEALFWYCFKKLILRGYKPRAEGINYGVAEERWKFYCGAARNKANYPDLGQYQRFRDMWVGLVPNQNMFDKGFDDRDRKHAEIEQVTADGIVTNPMKIEKEDE